jgi:hypothetical protein
MNKMIEEQKAAIELTVSKIIGAMVDLTVRGEKSFTFSFIGNNESALAKAIDYFKLASRKVESDYDEETNETYIWIEA